ncbi:MAG: AraC family transcriptional regulator [Tabrizicola sp.]|jgi:AraC-like DNA-binding protein|uniref:helix-turn-helix domain-containing protein n=1 Tax=Tabrizicola sp. TaxID=2005166 RepID=UPI001B689D6A|nr:AraC family transcriptional regulator [Tabrizicola sp.]MCC6519375.1 AraC family transcriptional regulator [Tabrizicola sp.]
MQPDLEVVQIGHGQSFKAWEHGYPFHTVRWHFHPELEVHHVVETSGHYYIGDFIGEFAPGNLVLTGPNLPHNWVSHVAEGETVPLRSRVLQFPEDLLVRIAETFPDTGGFSGLFALSRRGSLFSDACSRHCAPILAELVQARGPRRASLFLDLLANLAADSGARALASDAYLPDPSGFMTAGVNKALAYINANLTEDFTESDLAGTAGMTPSAFSRSFRRHTGMGVVEYINRLRINLACQMLMNDAEKSVTDICYAVGFNNLSNFNRQFLRRKGMPPSRFRALHEDNRPLAA